MYDCLEKKKQRFITGIAFPSNLKVLFSTVEVEEALASCKYWEVKNNGRYHAFESAWEVMLK